MKNRLMAALALLLMLASADAYAQRPRMRAPRPPRRHMEDRSNFFRGIGLEFGYANSAYRTVDLATDESSSSGMLHGFTAGLSKDFTLVRHALYFQMGLEYIYQSNPGNQTVSVEEAGRALRVVGGREEHHVAVPLRLKYDIHLQDDLGLSFDAGPTLLMGLSSKYKYMTRFSDDAISSVEYNLYNARVTASGLSSVFDLEDWMRTSGMYPKGRIGRADVMLGASVGVHFYHIIELRVGYDYGLMNRYRKDIAYVYNMRRGQFTLSAGIRF